MYTAWSELKLNLVICIDTLELIPTGRLASWWHQPSHLISQQFSQPYQVRFQIHCIFSSKTRSTNNIADSWPLNHESLLSKVRILFTRSMHDTGNITIYPTASSPITVWEFLHQSQDHQSSPGYTRMDVLCGIFTCSRLWEKNSRIFNPDYCHDIRRTSALASFSKARGFDEHLFSWRLPNEWTRLGANVLEGAICCCEVVYRDPDIFFQTRRTSSCHLLLFVTAMDSLLATAL